MSNLLVSIIVPVYKVEKYLGKCIESILAQTYQCWELILVNDGSPDHSGEICDEYARKDIRVRAFHKENAGVSSARNLGLDNAKGDYIMFVDADDWLSVDCLEVCVNEIIESNLDAIQFGFISVTSDKEIPNLQAATISLNGEQYIQSNSFNVCAGGGMYKRDIIERYNLRFHSQLKLAEDQIFVLSFFKQVQRIKYLDLGLYYYLQREDSAIHTSKSKDMLLSCKCLMDLSQEWPIVKSFVDRMIVLFIMNMIKNGDVPYRVLMSLYKKQNIKKLNSGFKFQRIFPRIATINFSFAYVFTLIYLKLK